MTSDDILEVIQILVCKSLKFIVYMSYFTECSWTAETPHPTGCISIFSTINPLKCGCTDTDHQEMNTCSEKQKSQMNVWMIATCPVRVSCSLTNSLTFQLRSLPALLTFKAQLKTHLTSMFLGISATFLHLLHTVYTSLPFLSVLCASYTFCLHFMVNGHCLCVFLNIFQTLAHFTGINFTV